MRWILALLFIITSVSCKKTTLIAENTTVSNSLSLQNPQDFYEKLSNAAISIVDSNVVYTPNYVAIPYPNGDVPAKTGVCTDVVIRAFRKLGIDLQKEVHEDMKANFASYPNLQKWGLKSTDTNIDHRRVPNLEVFFARKGKKLTVSLDAKDYQTGDIVTWKIHDKLPHIGIVTHLASKDGIRKLIVHNVGNGQVLEDCLFQYPIVGHFRYSKKLSD